MELVKILLPVLLTGSLGLLVVAAGIASSRGDFTYVIARPSLMTRATIAIVVIPTLAALAVISLMPISHAAKAGIFLMAISPVPPLVPGKAFKFGGNASYIYGIQGAGALMALITIPLLGWLGTQIYRVDATFPIGVLARNIAIGLDVPLAIGLVIGRWLLPGVSPALPRSLIIVANVLLCVALVPLLAGTLPDVLALVGNGTVVAMAIVVLIALCGGHLLGPDRLADRSTLAFAAAMRHPGIALALAGANHADKAISAAILLFMLVGIVTLVPYQMMIKRRRRDAHFDGVADQPPV